MEKAVQPNANLQQVGKLKDDEASFGCGSSRSERRLQVYQQMYSQRTTCVLTNLYHSMLVADPGTHS